jgi:hypothetical protein
MVFMLFLCVSPVSYGWGYRGWGPPYPRYLQRRRTDRLSSSGSAGPFKHESWGVFGDVVWVAFFVGVLWFVTALFWTRLWYR